MIRHVVSYLPLLLVLGSSGQAAAKAEVQAGTEAHAEALAKAFQERCFEAPKSVDGFKGALEGTERSAEFDSAFAVHSAKRRSYGERLVSAAGYLKDPLALVVRVEVFRPVEVPSEVMTCEVEWSGEFPKSLPALLGSRIGHRPRGPFAAQGADVYELTEKPRSEWNPADLDVVLVSNKPPLHSVSRMVSRSLAQITR